MCIIIIMYLHCVGDEWHLRKTNWCGEAADILDSEVRGTITVTT